MGMLKDSQKIVLLVLAAVACGVLGGAVGGYFSGAVTAERFLAAQPKTAGLTVPSVTTTAATKPETATSTQIRLVELADGQNAMRSVPESVLTRKSPTALVYLRRKTATVADAVLKPGEELARAVVVTSDGWFVTAAAAWEGVRVADAVLWYDGAAYKIEKAVSDRSTGVVFLKTAARDLPSPAFAPATAKRTGLAVWLETDAKEFTQSTVGAYRLSDYGSWASSDKVERRLVAQAQLETAARGTPIWDLNGSLVGVVDKIENGKVWAISAAPISASLQSLVSDGAIKHASLGLNAVDLSTVHLVSVESGMPTRGAWLKDDKKIAAVVKGAAGDKAGLKAGDVILQIDRDILDGGLGLGDIVMQYKPGVTVNFRVWRQGKEMEIPVTFGTQTAGQELP